MGAFLFIINILIIIKNLSIIKHYYIMTYSHYTSRGSIQSIKNGIDDYEPQDEEWLEEVKNSLMSLGDSCLYENYDDEDLDIISRLWGIYNNSCPLNKREFNPKYFNRE